MHSLDVVLKLFDFFVLLVLDALLLGFNLLLAFLKGLELFFILIFALL